MNIQRKQCKECSVYKAEKVQGNFDGNKKWLRNAK